MESGCPRDRDFTQMARLKLCRSRAVDSEIFARKPVIRGARLAVESILDLLATGQSENALVTSYPGLTREDILACLGLRQPSGSRIQSLSNFRVDAAPLFVRGS